MSCWPGGASGRVDKAGGNKVDRGAPQESAEAGTPKAMGRVLNNPIHDLRARNGGWGRAGLSWIPPLAGIAGALAPAVIT